MAKALEAHNDNDTWTRISLAALRVLTEIYETNYCPTREHQQAGGDSEASEDNSKSANSARVIIENKKRSSL